MKSSLSDRTVAVLHLLVAIALALLQPREPLPKSAGVRVVVQTSVWAATGAAASSAASSASAAGRGSVQPLGGGAVGEYRIGASGRPVWQPAGGAVCRCGVVAVCPVLIMSCLIQLLAAQYRHAARVQP